MAIQNQYILIIKFNIMKKFFKSILNFLFSSEYIFHLNIEKNYLKAYRNGVKFIDINTNINTPIVYKIGKFYFTYEVALGRLEIMYNGKVAYSCTRYQNYTIRFFKNELFINSFKVL